MILKNPKIQKAVSALLIIAVMAPSVLVFSKPKTAEAQFTDFVNASLKAIGNSFAGVSATAEATNTAISIKKVAEEIAKRILQVAARRALAEMTESTVNWINTGYFGSPLFLENPESFFGDIARYEIKSLIDTIGYDSRRFPFGKQFALNTIGSYKSQLETNAAYSLSKVTNDEAYLYNYRNNFSVGGWNGFLLHTQYPQNNPIGFQMEVNDELARRLAGTSQNAAEEVRDTLQQGLGFLSPKTCLTNPSYNNLVNEFQRPSFKFEHPTNLEIPIKAEYPTEQLYDVAYNNYLTQRNAAYSSQRDTWAAKNECPNGGLVATTPGSVVSSQITKALGIPQDQASLGAALGNSLSAVFDTLLNKFLGNGLNALASTVNPTPEPDNWDYYGNTLGSPTYNANDPFSGPDQEIILSKFKEEVAKGIENTNTEMVLIDNNPDDPTNPNRQYGPGIMQYLSITWPKVRELDICLPGPDIGWEDRLKKEMDRNSQKVQQKLADTDGQIAYAASVTVKNLEFAVDFFKDWITTKMLSELPNSIIYIDAVNEVEQVDQLAQEMTNLRRNKSQAVARLKAIQNSLSSFASQPAPGSQEEKDLITIWRQYDAIKSSISNEISVEDTQIKLDALKDRFSNLNKLTADCTRERTAAGWTVPADGDWAKAYANGFKSVKTQATGREYSITFHSPNGENEWTYGGTTTGKEREQFCTLPIFGGYTHESFSNPNEPLLYPEIPLVNGTNVFNWTSGIIGQNTNRTHIDINCSTVYTASTLDYKRSIPGINNVVEPIRKNSNIEGILVDLRAKVIDCYQDNQCPEGLPSPDFLEP